MTMLSPQKLAEASAAKLNQRDPATGHIGLALEAIAPGAATIGMTVEPQLLNGLDVCHGGFVFSLADTAMAYASNSRGRLTATAKEAATAGRTEIYDVNVRNQDGEMIAIFRGQTRTIQGEIVPQ